MEKAKKTVLDSIAKIEENMIKAADEIWDLAELPMQEFKSSKILADWLESEGFKVTRGIADMPTAFLGEWGSGRPIIGLHAEYDAMPHQSNEAVPYKKPRIEGGPGHGCGHNLLGAGAAGAAISVKHAMEDHDIGGTIRLYGSPAEEILVGKVYMTRAGLYDDLDAALCWHAADRNQVSLAGSLALISTIFVFTSKAEGYFGRNALDGVETMRSAVDINLSTISLKRKHFSSRSRVEHVIRNGGSEPNVGLEVAEIWYFLRAPNMDQARTMHEIVRKCAEAAALASDLDVEEKIQTGCYNTLPNTVLVNLMYENMMAIGAPKFSEKEKEWASQIQKPFRERYASLDFVLDEDIRLLNAVRADAAGESSGLASGDQGDVSWITPYGLVNTATNAYGLPYHTWEMVASSRTSIAHKAMVFGTKILAYSVIDLLTKPEILKKASAEFENATEGFVYECFVPPDIKPPDADLFKVENAKIQK
ncbi:amidohydrolase [Thermoproteota archaeon]